MARSKVLAEKDAGVGKTASQAGSTQSRELTMLKYTMSYIIHARKFQKLKEALTGKVATIGLTGIAAKVHTYTDFDDFLADIKQLVHSYCARHPKDGGIKKVTDDLYDKCQRDVENIKTCADCFEFFITDQSRYFSMVCAKPHLLVFAKLDDYPNWPAKVMSIDENIVKLEFFGDHTHDDIPIENCFLYTYKMFNQSNRDEDLKNALKELGDHIENIKKKFGSFVAFPRKTRIDPNNWENQLRQMIPGAFEERSQLTSEIELSSDESNESANESVADATTDMSKLEYTGASLDESLSGKKRKRDDVSDLAGQSSDDENDTQTASTPKKKKRYDTDDIENNSKNESQVDQEAMEVQKNDQKNQAECKGAESQDDTAQKNVSQEIVDGNDDENEQTHEADDKQEDGTVIESTQGEGQNNDTTLDDKEKEVLQDDQKNGHKNAKYAFAETSSSWQNGNVSQKIVDPESNGDADGPDDDQNEETHESSSIGDGDASDKIEMVDKMKKRLDEMNEDKANALRELERLNGNANGQDDDQNEETHESSSIGDDDGDGDASDKDETVDKMKKRLDEMNEDKANALRELERLKHNKATIKNCIAELDKQILDVKEKIFKAESSPVCFSCGFSLHGEKYYCCVQCENDDEKKQKRRH